MHSYKERNLRAVVEDALNNFPVVAILGPRQCGKSTLAKRIVSESVDAIHLDLERPSDLAKLTEPELFLPLHRDHLVCLDEIQRVPGLFEVLRVLVDEHRRPGRFLILGSASRELLRQSSETLAGRIAFLELTPFHLTEMASESEPKPSWMDLWLRGGFPDSVLAKSESVSVQWRENFILTFLERDIPNLGFGIPAATMRRLWTMLAHTHGQLLNSSRLGESMGLSHTTIRKYVDLLAQTFMVRVLEPLDVNVKKRLVKSPKVFVRDTGVLHTLLEIEDYDDLLSHPVFGSSWEGYVIEHAIAALPRWRARFFRTSSGTEIDLVLSKGAKRIAIECKASRTPKIGKGLRGAIADLGVDRTWIVIPGEESYPMDHSITVTSLTGLLARLRELGTD